ncbi:MAG: type VII secretion target [Propionibacteriaceae bacterium]|nr:type VII secretion target [Propionibacteriaceae bacterium]
MTGFNLSPTGLRSHAGHLGEITSGVELALDASNEANYLADNSLGIMVGPLVVGPLLAVENVARGVMRSAASAVDRLGQQLRETATDFETTDDDIGATFEGTPSPTPVGPVENTNPRITPNIFPFPR